MAVSRLRSALVVIVTAVALSTRGVVAAQDRANATRDDAVLIVDGVVREVFQSPRRDRVDLIVQIKVKRSEAVRSPRTASRVPMPAPGEYGLRPRNTAAGRRARPGRFGQRPTAASRCRRGQCPWRTISGASFPIAQGERWMGRGGQPVVRPDIERSGRRRAADPSPVAIERARESSAQIQSPSLGRPGPANPPWWPWD